MLVTSRIDLVYQSMSGGNVMTSHLFTTLFLSTYFTLSPYPFLIQVLSLSMIHILSHVQVGTAMCSLSLSPCYLYQLYLFSLAHIYKPLRVFCISSVYSLYRNMQATSHPLKSSGLGLKTLNCIRL